MVMSRLELVPSLWNQVQQFQNEMNRLFDRWGHTHAWPSMSAASAASGSGTANCRQCTAGKICRCRSSVAASRTDAVSASPRCRKSTSTTIEPSMPEPPRIRTLVTRQFLTKPSGRMPRAARTGYLM